jgi:hypothetical protein
MVKRRKAWSQNPRKYIVNDWGNKEMTIGERMKRLKKRR